MTIKQHGGVFGRNPKFNSVEAESLSIAGNAVPDASTILVDGDIGSTVQGYDADTAKLDAAQTFTAAQTFNENIVMANTKGIDFSATSDATGMTSELFDNYEEGTWTPVLTAATTNPTYTLTINQSFYTVIGRVCIFQTWIRANITDAGIGSASISLPFTPPANRNCAVTVAHQTISSSDVENGYIASGSSNVNLLVEDSTTAADFKTGAACDVMISGSYTIA